MARWITLSLAFTLCIIILHLVAFSTPGWFIIEFNTKYNASLMKGLLYQRQCDSLGNCRTATIDTGCSGDIKSYACIETRYTLATDAIQCLLPLFATCVVAGLELWAFKIHRWYEALTSICIALLSWANALQWVLVTRKAALTHAHLQQYDVRVPYSLIVFGTGAFFTSLQLLFYITLFVRISLLSSLAFRDNIISFEVVETTPSRAHPDKFHRRLNLGKY